ncbi:MAG: biosynthetic arginine decarboxylase [Alphaproteobacteria bacterium]|nr:biosynthetic arginine decarboxylase [Alphaproteobacteria bacterium]
MPPWSIQDSLELYNVPNWGKGFFDVNPQGHLVVTPAGPDAGAIDLHALAQELRGRGIELPILVRFTDIVRRRIDTLAEVFTRAIRDYEYKGNYRGVYPVKVNQNRFLVEDLVRFERPHHMGLEAGSKPELLIVLALLDDPDAVIICNGYKDESYVETAMLAQRIGRRPFIVIEKLSEVDTIIRVADRLGLRPHLGVRAKLSSPGRGRWETSSGDTAKFGLTAREIVLAVHRLRDAGYLDCLQLLHFHIGSQVTAIRSFKEAIKEAARTYVELRRMGAPMGFFDVGGGLGVDYDGSQTAFESSVNYTEQEYAFDVVAGIETACEKAGVPHPDIITEAGRAMVAHHAVLLFDVLGVSALPSADVPLEPAADAPDILRDLREVFDLLSAKNFQECYHDAMQLREDARTAFNLGLLSLEDRARVEHLHWQICARIRDLVRARSYVPDELQRLERKMADIYYCNFSVFQSAPDAWAINQLFPCMPIHRLDERPDRRAVLADITCDSDGKVDRFIDLRDVKDVLELHAPDDKGYVLGLFLVGAYQEILGDLHNLFGDTNAVHVSLDPEGGYRIDHVLEGDTVTEVLTYMEYDRAELIRRIRRSAEEALRAGQLTLKQSRLLVKSFQQGLEGYTYLERE